MTIFQYLYNLFLALRIHANITYEACNTFTVQILCPSNQDYQVVNQKIIQHHEGPGSSIIQILASLKAQPRAIATAKQLLQLLLVAQCTIYQIYEDFGSFQHVFDEYKYPPMRSITHHTRQR